METRVTLYDVGPRDGLQNEPEVLDAGDARRARSAAGRLGRAGRRGGELRRSAPGAADGGAEEVARSADADRGVVYAGLALNERGYERLVATGLDEVRFAFGVTESFNQRNQGASRRRIGRDRAAASSPARATTACARP